MSKEKNRKYGTDEGSRRGGATTRAMYYPYKSDKTYIRVRVDSDAADIVARVAEVDRSRFFTDAITNEMLRQGKMQ